MKKNRKPIKFNKPEYIRFRVLRNQLVNITIETGKENIFIPNENRFIVQKNLLTNKPNLLCECATLKTVDFTKFDFSEITTMKNWCNGCRHLERIIVSEQFDLSNFYIDNNIEYSPQKQSKHKTQTI